jgi:hypothetical protein
MRKSEAISILFNVVVGLVFIVVKLDGTPIENTLWAEDGKVFINQAHSLGWKSLWVTYAGCFYLYQRPFALFSVLFELKYAPYIFFFGWLLAYVGFIYVASRQALQCGIKALSTGALVILMLAQPHSGEVFFTLTNAHWFLGGALAIYLLVPQNNGTSCKGYAGLAIACLTGPFSLLLVPLLIIQLFIFRDWRQRCGVYLIVGATAVVQCGALLASNRIASGLIDSGYAHWVSPLVRFLDFGKRSTPQLVLSAVFWLTLMHAFLSTFVHKCDRKAGVYDLHAVVAASLVLEALLMFFAGLFISKGALHLLSPMGHSGRYFYIPYSLCFFSAWLVSQDRPKTRAIICFALGWLALTSFTPFQRTDLQFTAYAEFSKNKAGIYIPIEPQWPRFPSWHIRLPTPQEIEKTRTTVEPIRIDPSQADVVNLQKDTLSNGAAFVPGNKGSYMIFDIDEVCGHAHYLGVEVDMERTIAGWVQLFWSASNTFSEERSLRRFYPGKDITAQFALHRDDARKLRLDPLDGPGQVSVRAFRVYCIGGQKRLEGV